jgi:uncharacterized protein
MTAMLAHITRHPIKSHGREDLASVLLTAAEGLPFDRHWAVAHDAAKLVAGWNPCVNFARGAKAPGLMAISAKLDVATGAVTLMHPEKPDLTFRPDDADDLAQFLDWVRDLNPADRAQPAQIVKAGIAMTDTDFPSVSIFGLASNCDLSTCMGQDLSPNRWRGNLWVDGLAPWAEFDWVGRDVQIGGAVLQVQERIVRCKATSANPSTGHIDADTLGALQGGFGHQEFGVYARVISGGMVAVGDGVTVL